MFLHYYAGFEIRYQHGTATRSEVRTAFANSLPPWGTAQPLPYLFPHSAYGCALEPKHTPLCTIARGDDPASES